jgi:integrase
MINKKDGLGRPASPKELRTNILARRHILPFKLEEGGTLGGKKLWDIRRRHVKELLRAKGNYARNTVRHLRATLSSVLSEAADDELIEVNPVFGLSRKRKRNRVTLGDVQHRIRAMTGRQLDSFLVACSHERIYGVLYYTIAKTGLRPSEAVVLRPADVDFGARKIRVEKAWASGRVREYTKTGYPRQVDMSPQLSLVLLQYEKWMGEQVRQHGYATLKWLFPNQVGEVIDPNNAADAFARICSRAGIGHFSPYDLRHTYASLLLSRGAKPQYVQDQLGHETLSTTLKYYARWVPPERDPGYIQLIDTEPEARVRTSTTGERYVDLIDQNLREDCGTVTSGQERNHAILWQNSATEFCHMSDFEGFLKPVSALESIGEPSRNRTWNLLIKSRLQLSLTSII